MKANCEILWFLYGDKSIASSRLQGYIIHEQLLEWNINSSIIYSPANGATPDLPFFIELPYTNLENTISIIQKLRGKHTDRLIKWLKKNGSYVIYVNCDIEVNNHSWKLADMILATSKILCDYHKSFSFDNVKLIPEPYEYCLTSTNEKIIKYSNRKSLRACWFGNKDNWESIINWKTIIEQEFSNLIKLTTCSNHIEADIEWSFDDQKRLLLETDICLIPVNNDLFSSAKSPNRLIQAMAMGIPCITGPLDAYINIRDVGAPVFISYTDDDFRTNITAFLGIKKLNTLKEKSLKFVKNEFSPKKITFYWLEIFSSIESKKTITNKTTFSANTLKLLTKIMIRCMIYMFKIFKERRIR